MPRSADVVEQGFYSIEMLKTALSVSRRSIERAIAAKLIQPCAYTIPGRRARFSKSQVEGLRCRAKEKRSHGSKYVMGSITSIGTTPTPKPRTVKPVVAKKARKAAPNASAWLRKTRLKHDPDMLRSYQVAMKYLDLDAMIDD
jgi:hypothetical protein